MHNRILKSLMFVESLTDERYINLVCVKKLLLSFSYESFVVANMSDIDVEDLPSLMFRCNSLCLRIKEIYG